MNIRRAIVMGASSGIGREIARLLIARGWRVGVAARRVELLETLGAAAARRIDVTDANAAAELEALIEQLGGMDLYVHVSGFGKRNPTLCPDIELPTVATNADGFTRLVGAAYRYFSEQGSGHIAAITSIAGTRGMGAAPAYSATKAMQTTYLEALAQHARMHGLSIRLTDIRPGFVDTDFLSGAHYPLLMPVEKVARQAVRAIERGKSVRIIDWRWRLVTALWRCVSHALWRRMRVG